MNNPYLDYYANQAGSGIAGYQGYRYQRGHGFFGSLFRNILKPFGKYLGKKALETGVAVGSDVLNGENFKESAKKRLKSTGLNMFNDAVSRAKDFAQTGKGKRRRRKRKYKKSALKNKLKSVSKPKKRKKKYKKKKNIKNRRPFKKKKSKSKHLSHIF